MQFYFRDSKLILQTINLKFIMFEKFKFAVSIVDLLEIHNFFLTCLLAARELIEIFFFCKKLSFNEVS